MRLDRPDAKGISLPARKLGKPLSANRRVLLFGSAGLALVGLIVGLVFATGSTPSKPPATTTPPTSSTPKTTIPPTTTTIPALAANRCPLTDLPAPGGVPRRPALAIKVGNEPFGARPQSGLNEADIVFDTPAEGFIMRYIAIYQCNNAASIGPTRSVRWVDWHLVRLFHHAILAFAGGIDPNVNRVSTFSWLSAENLLGNGGSAGIRTTNRVPPDNLYTSTQALYRLVPERKSPPKPVFEYSLAVPPGGRVTRSFSIDFSYATDVEWIWDAQLRAWLHTYSGVPDVDALTGKAVTAKNVVVLVVHYHFGPYCESNCPGGSGDVESQTLGVGIGYVLRNGRAIRVFWRRHYLVDPFSFFHGKHERVTLAPGRTWVEIVPEGTAMSQPG
jgi:hypothetical protein